MMELDAGSTTSSTTSQEDRRKKINGKRLINHLKRGNAHNMYKFSSKNITNSLLSVQAIQRAIQLETISICTVKLTEIIDCFFLWYMTEIVKN